MFEDTSASFTQASSSTSNSFAFPFENEWSNLLFHGVEYTLTLTATETMLTIEVEVSLDSLPHY